MKFNIIIIGSGLTSFITALHLSKTNNIILITKNKLLSGASIKAQGGIATVLKKNDTYKNHIKDTLNAGVGICNKESVTFFIKNIKKNIKWLIKKNINFTKKNKKYHLTIEGGHSKRRIIHIKDNTGLKIQKNLKKKIKKKKNILLLKKHFLIDIIITKIKNKKIKCIGIKVLNIKNNKIINIYSNNIILTTGGIGNIYAHTSNSNSSTGDGIAIAARAKCRIVNMEFMQFHPTCLYKNKYKRKLLISEALRGEGAILTIPKNIINNIFNSSRFMYKYSKKLELAPRDIVTRAINNEMKNLKLNFLNLDISHKNSFFIKKYFPYIYKNCLLHKINITKEPIPIIPAAHYICGGILTNTFGCTDIIGLYAGGETTFTGLHGSNRLASNSLLECLVSGYNIYKYIKKKKNYKSKNLFYNNIYINKIFKKKKIFKIKNNLRLLMWKNVGIIKTIYKLLLTKKYIFFLNKKINIYFLKNKISKIILELRNLIKISFIIIKSALNRKESRGAYYINNYPKISNIKINTIIK
ncbi:L-aspartate oxidase [Candidatus Zinderia endosymbiont of Aphrophora alni]|uniref:L-aspartate oxidase n=1 Tax=Candidatus Zinderia endosymbiont of Aphrophora alni TaxID=3077951 RepID=UPI0030D5F63C